MERVLQAIGGIRFFEKRVRVPSMSDFVHIRLRLRASLQRTPGSVCDLIRSTGTDTLCLTSSDTLPNTRS